MNKLQVISLFSGGGGLDLGFVGGFTHLNNHYEKLPYSIAWAIDHDKDAKAVYEANQARFLGTEHFFACRDIRGIQLDGLPPEADIILAGFPCQPFSIAGARKGVAEANGTLFEEVERFVQAFRPKAFVLENVKGIMSSTLTNGTPVLAEIKRRLSLVTNLDGKKTAYQISIGLLPAENYGVPQRRHRVFIVGIRQEGKYQEPFNFNLLNANIKANSPLKLGKVIGNIPRHLAHAADIWALSPSHLALAPYIKTSWKDVPYDRLPPRLQKIRDDMPRYHSPTFFRRFGLEEIAGTITASAQPERCGILHPTENRRFSVREIARIQTFPDEYVFPCKTIPMAYKVIGNAVPPVLAHNIAKTLYSLLT